jgi:hypothetical protein
MCMKSLLLLDVLISDDDGLEMPRFVESKNNGQVSSHACSRCVNYW